MGAVLLVLICMHVATFDWQFPYITVAASACVVIIGRQRVHEMSAVS